MLFWESSTFWGIAGIVIGAIVAAFFFWLSKAKKQLEYKISSTALITRNIANIPGLNITLDGQQVDTVVSTTVRFFNAGNKTILPDDFATHEPLGISVTGQFFNISQALNLDSSNPNSSPSIKEIDEKNLQIEFDFLKPKQFIAITLLHNGDLKILGELKDGEKLKEKNVNCRKWNIFSLVGVFIGILLVLIGCYLKLSEYITGAEKNLILISLSLVALSVATIFSYTLLEESTHKHR